MIERATITVRSSSGMSVQPDIPIFVTTLSPSQDDGFWRGWMSRLSDSYSLQCVCSTRCPVLSLLAASVICKGEEEAFSLMQRFKPQHVAFV